MSGPVDYQLFEAAHDGSVSEVSSLLRDHPGIDGHAALHGASKHGYVEVVKLLLAHPNININLKDIHGQTPLSIGCQYGKVSVVRLLLQDPRVDIRLGDYMGRTPLWLASCNGKHEVVEWFIASGRDLGDVMNKKGKSVQDYKDYTALEIAREKSKTEVVSLLERFITNPAQTRHELRVKLGVLDELAAEVFAMTVFLCDDLLQLKPAPLAPTPSNPKAAATRFFVIASKLPKELQMILCFRVVVSMK